MRKNLALLLALLFVGFSALARPSTKQEQKPDKSEATAPASDAKQSTADEGKANPVKPTAESLAAGKKMYGYDCAMCHGAAGDGKGDLASDMKLKMPDFHDADAMKASTDGELFKIIRDGKGDMPKEPEDRAKSQELWNMINYIRSFAKKEASASDAAAAKP
jgi:mono/diheme cytochrome c family protein